MAKRISRVEAKLARGEKIRVIIYDRVSTERQEDDGTSLETQREDNTAYCLEHGYEIIDTVDETHTGYELEQRKKFKNVLRQCVSGEADAIVFCNYDRLSRNEMHFTVIQYDAERHGYELICVKEKFDENNIYDKIMRDLMAAFAELERMKIRQRTTEGKIKRAQDGKLIATKKPRYGYRYANDKHASYVINENEADIIRRIDTLYLEGYSQQKIAELFTSEGIPTPTGKSVWNHTTIAIILNCTEYHGEGYAYKRTTLINENGKKQWIDKPLEERIKMPEEVYPIIRTREIYEVLQECTINCHRSTNTCSVPKEMLLRGFIRCGICSRIMTPVLEASRYNGTVYRYPAYRCGRHPNGTHGIEQKHKMQIVAKEIEQATASYVKDLLRDFSVIERALTEYVANHSSQVSAESYDNAIEQLKARQNELGKELEDTRGNVRSILLVQMSKLEDEIEKIEAHKKEIKGEDGWRWEHIKQNIQEVIAWLHNGNENFDNATFKRKQGILRALGIVVYVRRGEKEEGRARKNVYDIWVSLPTLDSRSAT